MPLYYSIACRVTSASAELSCFAVGCSPSATSSEPLLYGSRHSGAGERLTTTMTTALTTTMTTAAAAATRQQQQQQRDVVEMAGDWRTTFNVGGGDDDDFGLSAARRRVVGRLRHDETAWNQTPRSTGRTTATRSRIDGQSLLSAFSSPPSLEER